MTNRIALVTGANKGIGFHIARKLGKAGVHVLVGARDPGRGESAVAELRKEGLAVELVTLDVSNRASIEAAVRAVEAKHGRLDILVNNAGIVVGMSSPTHVTTDELRSTFETNFFGVVATTNAFLPLLRKSDAPRIVNVSSGLGAFGVFAESSNKFFDVNIPAYQTSKTALDAITVMYAKELAGTPFKVNVVCPGYRATDLAGPGVNAKNGAGDPAEGADIAVRMSLLGPDGPSGAFFTSEGYPRPW